MYETISQESPQFRKLLVWTYDEFRLCDSVGEEVLVSIYLLR